MNKHGESEAAAEVEKNDSLIAPAIEIKPESLPTIKVSCCEGESACVIF